MRTARCLFGLSALEATFARRGFRAAEPAAQQHLEAIGYAFLQGYNNALDIGDPVALAGPLDVVDAELRGFAYEGAAMALALLDLLVPWRRDRLKRFLEGPGAPHVYMAHVGAGWALARLRRPLGALPVGTDPLLRWLALDGYGFHEGYFHPARTIERRTVPFHLNGYERRVFDQGLGRSLWFVQGADPARIAAAVSPFGEDRASDLWSGIGLACAYAGGANAEVLATLAGDWLPFLAQGAAFAAEARERAGNPASHTEVACRALCGITAADAAAVTQEALHELHGAQPLPAYEAWRQRIRRRFSPNSAPEWPPSPRSSVATRGVSSR